MKKFIKLEDFNPTMIVKEAAHLVCLKCNGDWDKDMQERLMDLRKIQDIFEKIINEDRKRLEDEVPKHPRKWNREGDY